MFAAFFSQEYNSTTMIAVMSQKYQGWSLKISSILVVEILGGLKMLYIFQHSISLEPFKIKLNGFHQNVPRVSGNKD